MKTTEIENDFVDDKVVFNTLLIPTLFYFTGWNLIAVASMIFFTLIYFSIPFLYKGDEKLYYKFRSFLVIFVIIYIPTAILIAQ